jgi:phage tail sheath gpL-like
LTIPTTISESWKLPLFFAVVDGSQAGNLTQDQPALIVGQMLPSGVGQVNVPTPIGSLSQAQHLYGVGSMVERMAAAFFAINTTQNLWIAAVADPTSGVAATGSITINTTATASGVVYLYIAGQLVTINAYTTDTPAIVATRLGAAINAKTSLPVTAVVDATTTSKLNLTCKWTGDTGNDHQISFNYLGLYGGQSFPTGFTASVAPLAGGTGQPDFTAIISNIQSQSFYHVAMPYNDTASLAAWDSEYGFGAVGRWSYTRQQYGWIYNALRADYADALVWGEAHNSAVTTTMLIEPTMPSPIYAVTAAYCANGAYYLLDDPARPLQTLPLSGILPALPHDRFSQSELNNLTNNGLAIQATNSNGVPLIVREALQYQLNAYGQADTAFALVTILSNLAALMSRMKSAITSKYPRHKLAPDGTKFGAGSAIVTPSAIKAELVSEAIQAVNEGLMSNITAFTSNLIVEIDSQNPNRVNVLYPPQLMGQLRQVAVLNQFRLLYNDL